VGIGDHFICGSSHTDIENLAEGRRLQAVLAMLDARQEALILRSVHGWIRTGDSVKRHVVVALLDGRVERRDDRTRPDRYIDVSASDIFPNPQFDAMRLVVARKGAFACYGLRRLTPAVDVTFGLRVNTLQGELTFKGPDVTRNQGKTCV
jgi:hypothetical protein